MRMRKKRTLAVRFSEPSGLPAYSAAPARNAAMSIMKPVDNHTTSIGMTEIMGVTHRPVLTTLEALVSRALEMVHSFREPPAKTSPGTARRHRRRSRDGQGANCPAAGGPLCVCADYSSRQPQLSKAHAAHSQRRFDSCGE